MFNPKRYSVMRDKPEDVGLGLFPEGNPGDMQVSEADILAEMIRRANGIKEPIQATAQVAQEPGPIVSKPIIAAAPTVSAPELDKGPYPDRIDPTDPIGSMANASRARNYYIADSTHNAGNIGDFFSLASRAVAGIGNVRGKMAETAVPQYVDDLKKTAAARAKMMDEADDRYQKALLSKSLIDTKSKSVGEAGYKAREAESRIALNNARANGLITQSQYNQALLDPTSYESLMTRLAAAGLGMSTSEVVPGSAIQPLLKTMSGAYNTNLGYDAKLAQQASQREIQAAQARAAGERLDTQTASQKELLEQRLAAHREIDEQRRIAQKEISDARIAADMAKNQNTTGTAKAIAEGRNQNALAVAKAKAQAAKEIAAQRAKTAKELADQKAKGGVGKGAAPKAPTADQRKAATFATRMEDAVRNLEAIEKKGFDRASIVATGQAKLPEALKPENVKLQEQAERNFINAQLRRESGAAIGASEFANAEAQYFPRVGDSPAVKAQKRANMRRAIAGMKAEAGEASVSAVNQEMAKESKPERRIQNGWIYERQPDGSMKPVGKAK